MEIRISFSPRKPIEPTLDQAIHEFIAPYLAAAVTQPSINVDIAKVALAAEPFFDANVGNDAIHDTYFYRFQPAWRVMLDNGNVMRAHEVWNLALKPALTWERKNPGKRIHKGTPYFFKGVTALAAEDIDSCYLLMHQAAREDIARVGVPRPEMPAVFFITLNWNKPQFAGHWVKQQRALLDAHLQRYRAENGKTLTSDGIQDGFLCVHDNLDTTVLFAYILARLLKLQGLPDSAKGTFASQMKLNLLGDLVLVLDDILKVLFAPVWDFGKNTASLAAAGQLSLSSDELKEVQKNFANDAFEKALDAALSNRLTLNGIALTGLQRDVALVYGLRNYRAHNVASAVIVAKRFPEIVQAVFNVLFLALEVLLARNVNLASGTAAKIG
jgi:hypothetical protein